MVLGGAAPAAAGEYAGPLIDAHSHVPNDKMIHAYVEAMKRHGVRKVLLLGVGGVQEKDSEWIAAAVRRYPELVVPGLPLAEPTGNGAARRVDGELAKGGARAIGEVHIRQVSRKIERSPSHPAFLEVLRVAARHKVPVVIHQELDARGERDLDAALKAVPAATIVLAHAGGARPAVLERLLAANPNLVIDLSGMHFMRRPMLATVDGPLEPAWKALIERMPDRFVMGIDVWAPQLFSAAFLDSLMTWTRRVLGELPPAVAEQIGYRNAARLYRIE